MKQIKRSIVAVMGGTVLAVGLAMIILPGPAFIVVPAGLAILAVEFAWARHWLRSARALLPRRSKDEAAVGKKATHEIHSAEHELRAPAGEPDAAAEKKNRMILALFLLTLGIGLLAQWHVKRTYARHSRTPTVAALAGASISRGNSTPT